MWLINKIEMTEKGSRTQHFIRIQHIQYRNNWLKWKKEEIFKASVYNNNLLAHTMFE